MHLARISQCVLGMIVLVMLLDVFKGGSVQIFIFLMWQMHRDCASFLVLVFPLSFLSLTIQPSTHVALATILFESNCWTRKWFEWIVEDNLDAVWTWFTVFDFLSEHCDVYGMGMLSVLIYQHNSLTCWTDMLAAVQKCTICCSRQHLELPLVLCFLEFLKQHCVALLSLEP